MEDHDRGLETFTDYRPRDGKQLLLPPHPRRIVETLLLCTVKLPRLTYEPRMHLEALSWLQRETVHYVCQRHFLYVQSGYRLNSSLAMEQAYAKVG
ncbi:hypothetical protein P8452_67011 [Trifolium repens]|nr:hypothetical protein P8452_67011 [Trifolium repens]